MKWVIVVNISFALETGNKRKTKDVWADVAVLKIQKIKLEMQLMEEEVKKNKIRARN